MKKDKHLVFKFRQPGSDFRLETVGAARVIVISNYYQLKSLADDLIATGYCTFESKPVLRSTEILPTLYDLIINPPCYLISAGVAYYAMMLEH